MTVFLVIVLYGVCFLLSRSNLDFIVVVCACISRLPVTSQVPYCINCAIIINLPPKYTMSFTISINFNNLDIPTQKFVMRYSLYAITAGKWILHHRIHYITFARARRNCNIAFPSCYFTCPTLL